MKFKTSILILAVVFSNFQMASGAENEYGIVRAWFNGENATVNDVQLKIGEPIEIKVEVISKINGHIFVKLKEPGVTKSFSNSRDFRSPYEKKTQATKPFINQHYI